jgi:glycosyltransferase involved in cell wall biosynthesis
MIKRKPKILHFMPDNHVWGGIEVYLKHTLPLLNQSGNYDIVAVVTQDSALHRALKEADVQTIGISFPFRKNSLWRSIWLKPCARLVDLSVYWRLWPILAREKPDLVHIHNGRIEQALIRLAGYPLVYTYHGYAGVFNFESIQNGFFKLVAKIVQPLFRSLIPHLDGMTIVSHYEQKRLYRENFVPENFPVSVIPNGLPIASLNRQVEGLDRKAFKASLGIPPDACVIGYFCRLRPEKNSLAVLRIVRQLLLHSECSRPLFLLIAGDGKNEAVFIDAFRSDSVLRNRGLCLGFRNDIPHLLAISDFTISTALNEGFGLRVLESMALGVPCVTYAVGGITEIMSGLPLPNRWLVPPDNEAAFVEKLASAMRMKPQAVTELTAQLQKRAQEFDIQVHIQQLEMFYRTTFNRLGNPSSSLRFTQDVELSCP